MITQTDFQLIRQLDNYHPATEGVTSTEEVKLITDTLQLRERDILSLRNLRDMYMLHYSLRVRNMQGAERKTLSVLSDAMMSVTFVIDLFLMEKGEPV